MSIVPTRTNCLLQQLQSLHATTRDVLNLESIYDATGNTFQDLPLEMNGINDASLSALSSTLEQINELVTSLKAANQVPATDSLAHTAGAESIARNLVTIRNDFSTNPNADITTSLNALRAAIRELAKAHHGTVFIDPISHQHLLGQSGLKFNQGNVLITRPGQTSPIAFCDLSNSTITGAAGASVCCGNSVGAAGGAD